MKKIMLFAGCASILLTSCVTNKKFAELESEHKKTKDLLNTATLKLNTCLEEKAVLQQKSQTLESSNADLKSTKAGLIQMNKDLITLTAKGATNIEKSLETLREKDLTIRKLQNAVTRRDSVNLALVQSLKGVLGNLDDEDINVSVEKGVVYVSISDKLLFNSGSYRVSGKAKTVLGKVATVVKNKPDFDFMVEGHTDNVPINRNGIQDNWDLSVLRATAIVRVLQNEFAVNPKRITAAGRAEYVPVADNDTKENRAKNRRTRIVVLPKIDQFYNMIEQGMKDPAIN